jgi:hypothetical protein
VQFIVFPGLADDKHHKTDGSSRIQPYITDRKYIKYITEDIQYGGSWAENEKTGSV